MQFVPVSEHFDTYDTFVNILAYRVGFQRAQIRAKKSHFFLQYQCSCGTLSF
jgi:hypothetical protein